MKKRPNSMMFDERRDLVCKWFDKWSDAQRRIILEDLIVRCKIKQLVFTDKLLTGRKPIFHQDPTVVLARVITLYMFSFLDPRSLCRCAQVSWSWRNIVEMDQLWLPKSVKRGWILPFSPSPYEGGTWKRLYVENAASLKFLREPKDLPDTVKAQMERLQIQSRHNGTPRSRPVSARTPKRPPWKGSDPTPKDTWRHNILENDDEISKVNKLRKKGLNGAESAAIQLKAKNKVNSGTHVIKRPSSVPRSRSAMSLPEGSGERPEWAKPLPDATVNLSKPSVDMSTMVISRPGPVRKAFVAPAKTVTIEPKQLQNDEMFHDQPWQLPEDGYESDT